MDDGPTARGDAMGQLIIEDPEVIADAQALADLLGSTMTDVIRRALRVRLAHERVQRDPEKRAKYEALMAIAERASKHFPPGTTSDHSDLYDENGLPV
ncbi:type II toxin-antitoxin system VapB family antitoxin [Paracraurococcus lichenis]|uniref:Type II toxin-antitoxin system VapB family antitoxin n=1 Tax=Paracraurococcus lichenis TaxID=3064888 RepID=A0ABT9E138_9PROT|nr:type II toxin-antitoxin system VapB family antitoxin [Paracraurococcus sp. LOR1-02]MDO9709820.1 type II toxin-antitoxin system VapB family antitoxin [Paracraurococcus sp. LOR1-02]